MKEILKALGPVKRRIRRNRLIQGAAAGLAAGLCAAVVMRIISFFVPLQDRSLLCLALAAGVTVLAACGNALRGVKDRKAAEAADACGLKERAVTALETEGNEPILELQRRDALKALEGLDVKKIRPASVRKPLIAALCGALLLGGLLLVPGARDREADSRKALEKTLKEGMETITRAAEQDEQELTEEEKSELRKLTADLDRELRDSRDEADALVAMDRAQQRLERLQQKTAGDAATAAADAEGQAGTGNEDGQAGNGENASEMSGEGQADSGNAARADASQLKTLQALSALKSSVNPSLTHTTAAMTGIGSGDGRESDGQSGQAGVGGSSGKQAGAGAGTGSTNEEQQGTGQKSSGPVRGDRDPEFKEEKYETIYDPEHIDKGTRDEMTNQERQGDDGSRQLQTGPGKGNLSGDVPWTSAVGEYAEAEARAAESENLTQRERQWVSDYYALLTEQQ